MKYNNSFVNQVENDFTFPAFEEETSVRLESKDLEFFNALNKNTPKAFLLIAEDNPILNSLSFSEIRERDGMLGTIRSWLEQKNYEFVEQRKSIRIKKEEHHFIMFSIFYDNNKIKQTLFFKDKIIALEKAIKFALINFEKRLE